MTDTTNPERKQWRDMTDAEKGALLLSHHRGGVIEINIKGDHWLDVGEPSWCKLSIYRTKPKPQRETVTMGGGYKKGMGWIFGSPHPEDVTHLITFDTIDGVPDPDSIRMMPIE